MFKKITLNKLLIGDNGYRLIDNDTPLHDEKDNDDNNDKDYIDPYDIIIIKSIIDDSDWSIAFKMGPDSIRIDYLSELYCLELKKIISQAKSNACFITVDFMKLEKRNPSSVYSTFYLQL